MTAAAWNSRDAHYRERIYRVLADRMEEPPWKRTTLMLTLSAHMPPDLGHRMLRALEHDGMAYSSPVKPGVRVWRLHSHIEKRRGKRRGNTQ